MKSVPPLLMMSWRARTMPSMIGSTVSRWDGFAARVTLICSPSRPVKVPWAPRWYFTSPEPCIDFGSRLPSNSRKIWAYDLPTMLASTFRRPRWAMPMTTSSRRDSAALSMTASSSGMTDSPPSREKRFWPTYFVCRKVSKASAAFSRRRMRSCSSRSGLECERSMRSWIHLRCLGSWMCMNSMPVVRQYESRSTPRMSRSFIRGLAGETADRELPLQVPQGEAVLGDVQVGVLALAVLQRVGVGHDVAADPVGVDQLEDAGGLRHVVVVRRVDVLEPADRLVRDAQRLEDLVVEAALAEQEVRDDPQELAGGGALDDPVVVGRRERHDLRDAELVQGVLGGALELRRVVHRADAHDDRLSGHQAGDRVDRAEAAGVGQETVTPVKSSIVSLPSRARRTMSS